MYRGSCKVTPVPGASARGQCQGPVPVPEKVARIHIDRTEPVIYYRYMYTRPLTVPAPVPVVREPRCRRPADKGTRRHIRTVAP